MQDQEKDPQRCRELRQNEENISEQIKIFADKEAQARIQLNSMRSELSDVAGELKNMQIIWAGLAASSAGRSLATRGSGLVASDISDKISIAKRKIQELEVRIGLAKSEADLFFNNKTNFILAHDKNVVEIRNLNCVI